MTGLRVVRATDPQDAVRLFTGHAGSRVAYHAGGTTVVDLMKLGVTEPEVLVDISPLREHLGAVTVGEDGLTMGALATMSEVADHPGVGERFPVIVQALRSAASAQLRNAATIGGNLLQRTRCPYFRDRHSPCNKRSPGTGCPAIGGDSRGLAILGTSGSCIANYPGDLAVALVALDARIEVLAPSGSTRTIPLEELHRPWGDRPDVETTLRPGELVTSVVVPAREWRSSVYVKVRDRASYAFALSSAAVAVVLDDRARVRDVRIALGGLAARPWRCRDAEELLEGREIDEETATPAARLCFRHARADGDQRFKTDLGRRTLIRALLDAQAMASGRRRGAGSP